MDYSGTKAQVPADVQNTKCHSKYIATKCLLSFFFVVPFIKLYTLINNTNVWNAGCGKVNTRLNIITQ